MVFFIVKTKQTVVKPKKKKNNENRSFKIIFKVQLTGICAHTHTDTMNIAFV